MGEEVEISILDILERLWHKAWVILICVIVAGGIAFGISSYIMTPIYSSSITLYVNNNMGSVGTQLNINDINASQKLVTTCIEILKSDMVLDKVISRLELDYTNDKLNKMISATALNNTEILKVSVVSENPKESAEIANMLAEIAPAEIIRVITAGGVQLIDTAVVNEASVGPNVPTIICIGVLLGIMLSSVGIIIIGELDTRIKAVKDLKNKYEIPVLGVVPYIAETIKK